MKNIFIVPFRGKVSFWSKTVLALLCIASIGCGSSSDTREVSFDDLKADGSETQTTGKLTLKFDRNIKGFNVADITLSGDTGATKGTLTPRTGTVGEYDLTITDMTESGQLTVSISKKGYVFTPDNKSVDIFYVPIEAAFSSLSVYGLYDNAKVAEKLILRFDQDIAERLNISDITLSSETGVTKGVLTHTGVGEWELTVTGVTANEGITITISKFNYIFTPNSRDVDVFYNTRLTEPAPFEENLTAVELVAQMKLGWNLGNTFDAHHVNMIGNTVNQMETAWGNPTTTQAHLSAIKNAGFDTIRIPVTWYKVLGGANNTIRVDWMNRVKQVVDWAIALDMIVILNTHHDEEIFKFTNAQVDQSLVIFKRVWEQIADTFKDYNEKLIFEALNEPRTKGAPHEWSGNAAEYANLNRHYQVFVNTVRASGGNNGGRILMVNTYAANAGQQAMNGLALPKDVFPNKLIVSIHAYEPFQYAHEFPGTLNDWTPGAIDGVMTRAYNTFVSKDIPVVMGEFGVRRQRHDTPRAEEWAEYYVSEARKRGIPCIWWDDGGNFRLFTRSSSTFHTGILAALKRGAGI
jgi:endoglucanase